MGNAEPAAERDSPSTNPLAFCGSPSPRNSSRLRPAAYSPMGSVFNPATPERTSCRDAAPGFRRFRNRQLARRPNSMLHRIARPMEPVMQKNIAQVQFRMEVHEASQNGLRLRIHPVSTPPKRPDLAIVIACQWAWRAQSCRRPISPARRDRVHREHGRTAPIPAVRVQSDPRS